VNQASMSPFTIASHCCVFQELFDIEQEIRRRASSLDDRSAAQLIESAIAVHRVRWSHVHTCAECYGFLTSNRSAA
jgi:hypothetical protein